MVEAGTRTVLVTGGAGFIGSHLCEALIGEGHRVVCLDSLLSGRLENLRRLANEPRFDFVEADVIERLPLSARSGFNRVYHLACIASPPLYQVDPEHTMLTNVVGTSNVLRLAEACAARFLLTSTSEVYGDPEIHPQPEAYLGAVSCTGPRACYDEGKRAAETLAFDFRRHLRAEVRVARLFNTYGPRMHPEDGRLVSNLICQALAGEDITVYGDGAQTRSFCHVGDTVDGLIRLMESGVDDGPVNLGNPVEVTVMELVRRVLAITGSRSRIVHFPLPEDDPRRRCPVTERARTLLGWKAKVGLEEGLRDTVAWLAGERGETPGVEEAVA